MFTQILSDLKLEKRGKQLHSVQIQALLDFSTFAQKLVFFHFIPSLSSHLKSFC